MKIPFDIKFRPQIESGEYKVETRDGRPARIICWDVESVDLNIKIVALIKSENYEVPYYFTESGAFWIEEVGEEDSSNDLFIITPEPELTEFEKGIKRGFLCAGLEDVPTGIIKDTAKELLELAKKELDYEKRKDLSCSYKIGFRDGKAEGYKEAMKEFKELPALTWPPKPIPTYILSCPYNAGGCTNPMRDCINCPSYPIAGISTTTGTSTAKVEG